MTKFRNGDRVAVKSAHPDRMVPTEANPKASYPSDRFSGPLRMSSYLKARMEEGDLIVVAPEDLRDSPADSKFEIRNSELEAAEDKPAEPPAEKRKGGK